MSVEVLIVNGFDRSGVWGKYDQAEAVAFPWVELCLRQLERFDAGRPFSVRVWDNAHLRSHTAIYRRHRVQVDNGWPRRRVLGHADSLVALLARTEAEHVVQLDNDAFPIRDGWLAELIDLLDGATLAGVWRDEMADYIDPFIHASCLAARTSDLRDLGHPMGAGKDVGQVWTSAVLASGREVACLRRSNKVNHHFLMGGIYGDTIYHQGAGNRRAAFWAPSEADEDERVRRRLRDRAFSDLDGLLSELRGERDPRWAHESHSPAVGSTVQHVLQPLQG